MRLRNRKRSHASFEDNPHLLQMERSSNGGDGNTQPNESKNLSSRPRLLQMEMSCGGGDRHTQPSESQNLSARPRLLQMEMSCGGGDRSAQPSKSQNLSARPLLLQMEMSCGGGDKSAQPSESQNLSARSNAAEVGNSCHEGSENAKPQRKLSGKKKQKQDCTDVAEVGKKGYEGSKNANPQRKLIREEKPKMGSLSKIFKNLKGPKDAESAAAYAKRNSTSEGDCSTSKTNTKSTKKVPVKSADQSVEPSSGLNGVERATTNTIVKKKRSVRVKSVRSVEPKEKRKNGQSVEPRRDESPETEDVINLGPSSSFNAVEPADYMESGTFVCMISKSPFDLPVTQANGYMRYGRKILKCRSLLL